jgi:hypothetical protein
MNKLNAVVTKATSKPRSLSAAVAILIILSSCSSPFTHGAGTTAAAVKGTGSITLQIPSIAAWIKSAGASKTTSAATSRAMALATSVSVQVLTAQGANVLGPVMEGTWSQQTANVTVQPIPPGTDYTVNVRVYNSNVSNTTPVVQGQATGVNIAAGSNPTLNITCIPVSPLVVTPSTAVLSPTLATWGEQWYSVQVASGTTYYIVENNPGFGFAIFDNTGTLISSNSGFIQYAATYTGTMYVGLINNNSSNNGTGGAIASLQISLTPPVLNEGSASSPVALALDQNHTFKIGPQGSQGTSYYSFTTTSTGTYALNITSWTGTIVATLYSDQGYSAVVAGPTYNYYGCVYVGLTATKTYYLALTNPQASSLTFGGQIDDPAYIAANSNSQGSVASPVSLQIGTSIATEVDGNAWDRTSYYSFTTGSGQDYALTVTNVPSATGYPSFTIYSDAGFSQYVLGVGTNNSSVSQSMPPLSPNTTYYLEATNGDSGNTPVTFTLEISSGPTPTFTTLPTDGSWNAGSESNGSIVWYVANVTAGPYTIAWDDADQGSGTYKGFGYVCAYLGDRLTPYFTQQYQGYTTPQVITVPAGQSQVFICFVGQGGNGGSSGYSSTGSFALQMAVPAPSGSLTITGN